MRAVRPRYAVFGVTAGSQAGYPHSQTVRAMREIGSDVSSTRMNGDVRIVTDVTMIELSVDRQSAVETGREGSVEEQLGELMVHLVHTGLFADRTLTGISNP